MNRPLTAAEFEFRASWPIEDQDLTLADLIREAEPDLADLLHKHKAVLTGPAKWRLADPETAGRPASDCPSAPGTDPLVLLLTAPATLWVDFKVTGPRPHLDAAQLQRMRAEGKTPAEIATELGAHVASIRSALRKAAATQEEGQTP